MDFDSISHENYLLKQELQDLKKEFADLVTTNNFLLEQNAQLRYIFFLSFQIEV